MITIDRDELIIYIDALTKVIKSNWEDVPEEYEDNSVACAEHMVETMYKENY